MFNTETLGLILDDYGLQEALLSASKRVHVAVNGLRNAGTALSALWGKGGRSPRLHRDDHGRTIFIDTTGTGITEFSLDKQEITTLIANGRKGVDRFFERRRPRRAAEGAAG